MKIIHKFYILIIFFMCCTALSAQDMLYNKKVGLVVKTDLLVPIFIKTFSEGQGFSLSAEKLIRKRQSIQLTGVYYNFEGTDIYKSVVSSFQVLPEYRIYLEKDKQQRGFYAGVYSGYVKTHSFYRDLLRDSKTEYIRLGVQAGIQVYFFKHLSVDLLGGVGASRIISYHYVSTDFIIPYQKPYRPDVRLELSVGYLFN